MENKSGEAKVQKVKNWSPVWIFPIVTALIGAWILFYHYSHQGPEVTLITTNAEGIEGGKTTIKSRSVDVGVVESATLTDDLTHVEIKARLNAGMEKLLHSDSVFWVVKPQVGREGISGLGTLLSGAYIELQPGSKGNQPGSYSLLDAPPLAPPDAKGIRVILDSKKAGQLSLAIRYCSADTVWVQLKPARSIRKNAPSAISCLLTRQTIVWSPAMSVSGKTAVLRWI